MSLVRIGSESDIAFCVRGDGYMCLSCLRAIPPRDVDVPSTEQSIDHIEEHIFCGDRVPAKLLSTLLNILTAEIKETGRASKEMVSI